MKLLQQFIDTKDDSTSYTIIGANKPTYRVDSRGSLTKNGETIGKYYYSGKDWILMIGEEVYAVAKDGLFHLPDFELESLTKLLNDESKQEEV